MKDLRESAERIAYIADYITAYEEKVRLLNAHGLFDAATLFELFAIEIGGLYLGQQLYNLNIGKYNYPCVDLISADKQTYIQVSTTKDIPTKIKNTLENIRDSKREDISSLTSVIFMVLSNDSVEKIKDYIGDDQIGRVPFIRTESLITTSDILQRATTNLDFQISLYNMLKKGTENIEMNSDHLNDAIERSRRIGLRNIDCKINNEYEINRSELVSLITTEDYKNISIQGRAGSGKSALCKMLVENEAYLLYARAERFLEVTDINSIWGFNVKQIMKLSKGKRIVFFIDALEFISDIPSKLELLQTLYDYAGEYSTIRIITSCRTSDKNSFIRLESNYNIMSYDIPELTTKEQLAIARNYPIIERMHKINAYKELLENPFYINLIVTKINNIDNIIDENELREYIWEQIVCLNDSDVKKVVESIVFDRAQSFLLGAIRSEYDSKIIEKLISNDILITNGDTVRLKYDIFEDICFEQYFDKEFLMCRGIYKNFFQKAETLGRCIYRRFQIWISNKLLAKQNREKFLYELCFSEQMPEHWRKQTEIGLVKSRYSAPFFEENEHLIIDSNALYHFINMANLYAFEIDSKHRGITSFIRLRPSGVGRGSLIHLIAKNKMYEGDLLTQSDLEKLCGDYSNSDEQEQQIAEEACLILEHYVERFIVQNKENDYYKLDNDIKRLLKPIYSMAKHSISWIKDFWLSLEQFYKSGNTHKERFASDIIEDALKSSHIMLAEYLPRELCAIAKLHWTYSPSRSSHHSFYEMSTLDTAKEFGLNANASNYEHESKDANSIFFTNIFMRDYWIGLQWGIGFVNRAISTFAASHSEISEFELYFIETDTKRSYLGDERMWLVTAQERYMPMIICDLIYCLKGVLRVIIKSEILDAKELSQFVEMTKRVIYEKSNNIALLTVISDLGMEFRKELPGLALDITTNIHLIMFDLSRHALSMRNPAREMLERQILMTMSMPYPLPRRYDQNHIEQYDLLDYICDGQLYYGEEIKEKCHNILDYLYSIVPNNKSHAVEYLQIQKMDLRTAQAFQVNESIIALVPTLTGEAEKLRNENELDKQSILLMEPLVRDCIEKMNQNRIELEECLTVISFLIENEKHDDTMVWKTPLLVAFIARALDNNSLDQENRAKICNIWIEGIKGYFANKSFIFEHGYCGILFKQIESDACKEIVYKIKQLMLDLILYEGSHGIISKIANYAKEYLLHNQQLAKSMFNTVLKLAEDEMNHQKHNAEYIKKNRLEAGFKFSPNMQPKLSGIDQYIQSDDGRKKQKYKSKKDVIVKEYLFEGKELDTCNFNASNYDISTLCYAVNCGLPSTDASFVNVVRRIIACMIDVWKANIRTHKSHDIIGTSHLYQVMAFFQRELIGSNHHATVLDILFTNIEFSKFTSDTIKFYQNIFGSLLSEYFDAHSDMKRRAKCVAIIGLLEDRVVAIKDDWVRLELYKSLTLSLTSYGALGDWSKCPSGYSYQDKRILNRLFSKYGRYHLSDMVATLHKLHIDKLLPEILLSVKDAFLGAFTDNDDGARKERFADTIRKQHFIILSLITKAFFDFSDQIKQDVSLTEAFEVILEMLISINSEEAATILDEFRVR